MSMEDRLHAPKAHSVAGAHSMQSVWRICLNMLTSDWNMTVCYPSKTFGARTGVSFMSLNRHANIAPDINKASMPDCSGFVVKP